MFVGEAAVTMMTRRSSLNDAAPFADCYALPLRLQRREEGVPAGEDNCKGNNGVALMEVADWWRLCKRQRQQRRRYRWRQGNGVGVERQHWWMRRW